MAGNAATRVKVVAQAPDDQPKKPGPVSYSAGTLLFKEGDAGGDVIIIQSGSVEVFQKRNGQEWILSTLGKGELLGVMTVLTADARTASARALTDVTGIVVSKEQIATTLKAFPAWGTTIIKDLVSRVRTGNDIFIEKAMEAEGRTVDDPLALAVMISSSLSPILSMMTASGETVTFNALTNRVADVLGIEAESVTQTLEVFNEEKLLEHTGKDAADRSFQISSVKRLKPFAEFVRNIKRMARDPVTAATILAVGEREALLQVAEQAISQTSEKETVSTFNQSQFAQILRKCGDEGAIKLMLTRAEALGYLKLDMSGEHLKLQFAPGPMAMTMRFYNIIKRLNPHTFAGPKNLKKAMAY